MAHVRAPGFGRSEVLDGLQRGGFVKSKRRRKSVRRKALRSTAAERHRIAREAAVEAAVLLRQGAGQRRQIGRITRSAVRAVQSTPTFGLEGGRAARQVQQEIKGQTGDIIGFGRAQKKLAASATRQEVAGVQADALQQARDLVFRSRQDLREASGQTPEGRQRLQLALRIGRDLLERYPGQEPTSKQELDSFTGMIARGLGGSQVAWLSAVEAAKRLRRAAASSARPRVGSLDYRAGLSDSE